MFLRVGVDGFASRDLISKLDVRSRLPKTTKTGQGSGKFRKVASELNAPIIDHER